MERLRSTVIAGLAATLTVVAVSVSPAIASAAAKKPPKMPDACEIVPQAAAEALVGTTLTQSVSGTSCQYEGDGGIAAVSVQVMNFDAANAAFTKKQIKTTPGATFPKLGDAASEALVDGGGGEIKILKGKTLLDISARKSDGAGNIVPLDPATFAAFAKAALAKTAGASSANSKK